MSALQLEDVKAYLNIQSDATDDSLQAAIDAAEASLAQRVGPIAPTSVTRRVTGSSSVLVLPVTPAISLTSVTPYLGQPVDVSNLYLDPRTGLVSFNNLIGFPSLYYDVVYVAGRAECPADLLEAIRALVEHMWQPQRGPRSNAPSSTANEPAARAAAMLPGAAHALPYRVAELIAPYIQTGVG